MALSEREARQIEEANRGDRTPVVFIHGLWLLPSSWDRWAGLFEEAGYATVQPDWPGDPETVEQARANPDVFAGTSIAEILDHTSEVIVQLEKRPAVVGHSFGGMFTQIIAGRGLSDASVAIDPALRPVPRGRVRQGAVRWREREPEPWHGGEGRYEEPRARPPPADLRGHRPHRPHVGGPCGVQEAAGQSTRDRVRDHPEPRTLPDDRRRLAGSRPDRSRLRQAVRLVPERGQGPIRPLDRVGTRQRDGLDVRDDLVVLARIAAPQIPWHPVRIGADDQQVAARRLIAVARPRGKHEDVARPDLEAPPARPTQLHGRRSADDAEDLVGDRMEVVEREDPVAPVGDPAVGLEELLAGVGVPGRLDVAVDEHRQARVRDRAVVFESLGLGSHAGPRA